MRSYGERATRHFQRRKRTYRQVCGRKNHVGAFVGVLAYYMAGVEANNAASVTPAGKDTMWTMLVLVAAISFFLTVIPLFFYKFNEKQQQEAVAIINERKKAAAEANEAEDKE